MRERRTWTIVIGCLCVALAACGGGSGSTGLVTSEDAIIDQVRETGTCDDFQGASYCATDSPAAVGPGGERVSIVTPVPTAVPTTMPTATPEPASPTPGASSTVANAPTPTPTGAAGSTSTPGFPTPAPTATPAPGPTASPTEPEATSSLRPSATEPAPTPTPLRTVTAVVDGFALGAACATAARPAESADAWRTAALVEVVAGNPTTFPISPEVVAPLDLTLLCFTDPPAQLVPSLATLSDADPTVVFVLPSP